MSGFFGIFRPQGGPVDLEAFEQMRKATEREGFDGLETHVEDKIAMGHLMLRVSPESKHDKQPLKSDCGNYVLVGHFRLDYRDELGDKLGLTQLELGLTPDSQLVMLAYIKWIEKCVDHIEGDWAFALYDSTLNGLFFAKDKLGYSALYYTQIGDEFYFASDGNLFKKILKTDFQTDLSQLQRLFIPGLRLRPGTTLVKEVLYLNAGSFMSVSSYLTKTRFTYWELTKHVKIKFNYDDDAIQVFRSILSRAIHTRLSSSEKTGIFLSSGIDSNTIAYFAAKELKKGQSNLFSFTSCPAFLHEIPREKHERVSEQYYLKRQLVSLPNVIPEFLNFDKLSIGEILISNKTTDILFPIINTNTFWIDGILLRAKKEGVKKMLNGQMGNFTLSWNSPNYLSYLFLNLYLFKFYREFLAFLKNYNLSFFYTIRKEILTPCVKFIIIFFKIINPFYGRYFFKQSILTKYLSARINWNLERLHLGFIPGFDLSVNPEKLRKKIVKTIAPTLGMKWYKESHANYLTAADPTIDVRLLEFSFTQSESIYFKKGIKKYLVRNMMKGLISDEILFYNGLFPQSYDIGFRLKTDLKFHEIVKEIELKSEFNEYINFTDLNNTFSDLLNCTDNIKKISISSKLLKNISLLYTLKGQKLSKFTLQ